MDVPKMFRRAYIVEPGYDFRALRGLVREYRFLLTGAESQVKDLRKAIVKALEDFDPEQDLFVPVGRILGVMIAGEQLAFHPELRVAVFAGGHYNVLDWRNPENPIIATTRKTRSDEIEEGESSNE